MDYNRSVEILRERGLQLLAQPRPQTAIQFALFKPADELLNDIENKPHAYVLACLMQRQFEAKKAWVIPYKIQLAIGSFDIPSLLATGQQRIIKIFERDRLHRFNHRMGVVFYRGVERIQAVYDGNAADIWLNSPASSTVVQHFRAFHGAGEKIATMAANILVREFKIPMADYAAIDISADIHTCRVFGRLGFTSPNPTNKEVIMTAKQLNPSYPGVFDLSAWEIGNQWCRPSHPICEKCYLNDCCPKTGVSQYL